MPLIMQGASQDKMDFFRGDMVAEIQPCIYFAVESIAIEALKNSSSLIFLKGR